MECVKVSSLNIHVENSFLVQRRDDIKRMIKYIKNEYPEHPTFKHSEKVLVAEWCVHNLLYNFGLFKERTKHVDLNSNKTILEKWAYLFIALFYTK